MKKMIIGILAVLGIFYLLRGRERTIVNFPNEREVIVAFGDSLTAGYGAPAGTSYPDVLATKVDRPVVNMGVSGETAVQAPQRLREVLAKRPYMVLIEFGANDFMRRQSTQQAVAAVERIVNEVQQAGSIAVIIDTGGPGMDAYTQAYKQLAKQKGALYVPGIMKGIFYHPKYKSDQVHPNQIGYAKIADKVYKVIKNYL